MDKRTSASTSGTTANLESDQRFRALVLATSDVIYRLSADWEVMHELDGRGFLRDASQPITGWKEINVFAGDMSMVNKAIAEAISEKKPFALEHRVNRADGTTGWTFSRAMPIQDDKGNILEWLGAASDITARKETEYALTKSKEEALQQQRKYETITSSTPDLMYVFDLDYRFTYANEALLAMWGKPAEEAIGKGLLDNGYEPWHAEMHHREIDHVIATGEPIRGEVSFPHAELGKRVYDYIFTPVFGTDGKVEAIAGTTRDVTELRNAMNSLQHYYEELQTINEELAASNEELLASNEQLMVARQQLSESETVLRQALSAANFGTWVITPETGAYFPDTRVKQLLGFSKDAPLSFEDAVSRIHPEYRQSVLQLFETALKENGNYDVTYPLIGLQDTNNRWLRAIGNFSRENLGTNPVFTGLLMDVTEQKTDEIRKNDFIAMVSHELKTPLTSMKGYLQVVLRKLKDSGDVTLKTVLEKANVQVERMTGMINGFLNLARLETGKIGINLKRFNLAELMNHISEEIELSNSSHHIIFGPVAQIDLDADQDKIEQVIHNLISNAVKYAPAGSEVNIDCSIDNKNVKVSVRDQGIGIEPADLEKVFDRYYRVEDSKTVSVSGFGIGLYLCKEIIAGHGGKIWAESEPGKGATFIFTIPVQ